MLAHGFRSFSPWLVGPVALVTSWKLGRKEGEEGAGVSVLLGLSPGHLTSSSEVTSPELWEIFQI